MTQVSCAHPDWCKDLTKLPIIIEPAEDRYVIVPDEIDKSEGGFQFVENSKVGTSQVGTIVAVGGGLESQNSMERMTMDYKVGDKVAYGAFTGDDFLMAEDGDLTSFKFEGTVLSGFLIIKVIRQGGILFKIS